MMRTVRVYCARFWDADDGQLLSWHTNRRDAERELRRMQREGRQQGPAEVEAVDLPTSRAGLVGWLNARFTTDNG